MRRYLALLLLLTLSGCRPVPSPPVDLATEPAVAEDADDNDEGAVEVGAPICPHCGSHQSFGLNAGFRQCFECWGIFEADSEAPTVRDW